MSVERNIALPPEQQEIKEAFRALVKAYGGQDAVAKRLGTRQQRISDCCSTTTDAFPRADEIATLEAETVGYPGHPHVTTVLARQRLRELVPTPNIAATGSCCLPASRRATANWPRRSLRRTKMITSIAPRPNRSRPLPIR